MDLDSFVCDTEMCAPWQNRTAKVIGCPFGAQLTFQTTRTFEFHSRWIDLLSNEATWILPLLGQYTNFCGCYLKNQPKTTKPKLLCCLCALSLAGSHCTTIIVKPKPPSLVVGRPMLWLAGRSQKLHSISKRRRLGQVLAWRMKFCQTKQTTRRDNLPYNLAPRWLSLTSRILLVLATLFEPSKSFRLFGLVLVFFITDWWDSQIFFSGNTSIGLTYIDNTTLCLATVTFLVIALLKLIKPDWRINWVMYIYVRY